MTTSKGPGRRRAVMIGLIILAIFAASVVHLFYKSDHRRLDYHVYYDAAVTILNGQTDLYRDGPANDPVLNYRYPPVFAVLFGPFTLFSVETARWIWLAVMVAASFVWIFAVYYLVRPSMERPLYGVVAIAGALTLVGNWSWESLRYNNAHLLVLLLMLASFLLANGKRVFAPALALAIAVSIKVFPLLLIPYFAVRRQWSVVGMTVALLVVLNLLPAIYVGFDNNLALLRTWYSRVMVEDDEYLTRGPANVSIKGAIERLLADVPGHKGTERVKIAALDPTITRVVYLGAAGIIFSLTILLLEYFRRRGVGEDFALHAFGLVLSVITIIGPRTNDYFLAVLFIPLTVMIACCIKAPNRLNLAIVAGIFLTSVLHIVLPRETRRLMTLASWNLFLPSLLSLGMLYNIAKGTGAIRMPAWVRNNATPD